MTDVAVYFVLYSLHNTTVYLTLLLSILQYLSVSLAFYKVLLLEWKNTAGTEAEFRKGKSWKKERKQKDKNDFIWW